MGGPSITGLCGVVICHSVDRRPSTFVPTTTMAEASGLQFSVGCVLLVVDVLRCRRFSHALWRRLLPIYLGPMLMLLFGWRIVERLALVAQSQNTVSIADFIANRFGRSQRLAALVALIATVAAVPYLALQYKAVALSLRVLTDTDMYTSVLGDPALYVAILMALFLFCLVRVRWMRPSIARG